MSVVPQSACLVLVTAWISNVEGHHEDVSLLARSGDLSLGDINVLEMTRVISSCRFSF